MPDTRLVTGEIVRDDEGTEQVIAVIDAPVRRDLGDDYACRVCIPRLFADEKWVTGADAGAARTQALHFVEAMFDSHGIRLVWRSPG